MAYRYAPISQPERRSSSVVDALGLLPYRRRITAEDGTILEFVSSEERLVEWAWPVNEDGERVPPSELVAHRNTHCFKGPGCLCAALDPDPNAFTEAAIFRVRTGRLSGNWVAACAHGVCRYFYIIERIYPRQGILVKRYPRREPGEVPPPPVTRGSNGPLLSATPSVASSPSPAPAPSDENRAPKRSADVLDDDGTASTSGRSSLTRTSSGDSIFSTSSASTSSAGRAPQRRRIDLSGRYAASSSSSRSTASTSGTVASSPSGRLRLVRRNPRVPTPFIQLLKLDEFVDGGLSDREFRELFVQCQVCRRWVTERVYRSYHTNFCVIDLTNEAEECEVIDLTHLD
ncbi:hypothetical protein FA95DRAFT_1684707 [Auriscalpium vulgare]|uniref:Uncharacterized protein n=1 Tax=Auriscalpium vulgare TaxID=40419 RepID=A0ACB8R2W6_9AGAM|nr:hypothetical protein FA95DRAFT_1684707 [Auriscalpium vulgare]